MLTVIVLILPLKFPPPCTNLPTVHWYKLVIDCLGCRGISGARFCAVLWWGHWKLLVGDMLQGWIWPSSTAPVQMTFTQSSLSCTRLGGEKDGTWIREQQTKYADKITSLNSAKAQISIWEHKALHWIKGKVKNRSLSASIARWMWKSVSSPSKHESRAGPPELFPLVEQSKTS